MSAKATARPKDVAAKRQVVCAHHASAAQENAETEEGLYLSCYTYLYFVLVTKIRCLLYVRLKRGLGSTCIRVRMHSCRHSFNLQKNKSKMVFRRVTF